MKKYLLNTGFLILSLSQLFAQSTGKQALTGYWRMSYDGMQTGTLMKILPADACSFYASYKENGQLHKLTGMLYDEQRISVVENSNEAKKFIYTGQMLEDGSIFGDYYSPNCKHGTFSWLKVCDESGSPLIAEGADVVPCVEQEKSIVTRNTSSAQTTTKVIQQVIDKTEYVGEPRNESIPLTETTTFIPEGAIFVGNIGLGEKITYRTVEIEVPVEAAPYCAPKEEMVNDRGEVVKREFSICDAGTNNPTATRGIVVPGKRVAENGIIYHIVGKGETMYSIAKRYGITIKDLAELNGKDCEHLIANERLRVSK